MNRDPLHTEVELANLHTFGLSAKAFGLKLIADVSDLLAFAKAKTAAEPSILLSEGSNTVFLKSAVNATVWKVALKGRQYLGVQDGCHVFRVAAGENWHNWVEWSVCSGYAGLENLALIPGAVGASPIQNIGAYGIELKDRIKAVHVFDWATGQFGLLTSSECKFSYRNSIFKSECLDRFVITAVDFSLPVKWQPVLDYGDLQQRCQLLGGVNPVNVMKGVIAIRTEKLPDPQVLGNSGSFFKNPIVEACLADGLLCKYPKMPAFPVDGGMTKLAAGWLVEQAGLKGHTIGGIQVYPKQALILTNLGHGTGSELLEMIELIKHRVHSHFGVSLEPEPNLIQ